MGASVTLRIIGLHVGGHGSQAILGIMIRRPIGPQLSSRRAQRLIEAMLKEMQLAVRDPARFDTPQWERLFGNKQSVVVNLQKLVQTLAALPQELPASTHSTEPPAAMSELSAEEMRLLSEWIAQGQT